MDEAHHSPAWVKVSPFVAMLIGLGVAYLFYIVDPRLPVALARHQPVLYRFLLNKWYFDEIYEVIFVRPAKWLGHLPLEAGRRRRDRRLLNGVAMGIVPWVTRLAGRAQSGYLFHYAFAMVIGLVFLTLWLGLGGGAEMNSLLSLVTFLPLIGAVVLLRVPARRGRAARSATPSCWRCSPRPRPSCCRCSCWRGSIRPNTGFQFVEERGLDRRADLQDGRRRHLGAVRDADDVPDAADDRRELERHRPGQGVHGRLPGARDADARRLLRARPRAVLPVLRGRADPDVPDHRHLGRQGPHLRQLQVLPLHLPRLGADAGRDDRDVHAGRHHRHPDAADPPVPLRDRCGCSASPWSAGCRR